MFCVFIFSHIHLQGLTRKMKLSVCTLCNFSGIKNDYIYPATLNQHKRQEICWLLFQVHDANSGGLLEDIKNTLCNNRSLFDQGDISVAGKVYLYFLTIHKSNKREQSATMNLQFHLCYNSAL